MTKIICWNVNGIRAAIKKGLADYIVDADADVVCLQETKAQVDQVDIDWIEALGYRHLWNSADKKGYSGVTTWIRDHDGVVAADVAHRCGMDIDRHDHEGRLLTVSLPHFDLVNVYTPNAQNALARLEYRCQWDADFLRHVGRRGLGRRRPVIFCGDLNVAHKEIDLANPKSNRNSPGFTDAERAAVDRMIDAGFCDAFRRFDDSPERYTWWSYRTGARSRNVGWRIDYFMVDDRLIDAVESSTISADVTGSDHCPIELTINAG